MSRLGIDARPTQVARERRADHMPNAAQTEEQDVPQRPQGITVGNINKHSGARLADPSSQGEKLTDAAGPRRKMNHIVDQAGSAKDLVHACRLRRPRNVSDQDPPTIRECAGNMMKTRECHDRIAEAANAKNKDGLR
jgi:hypothetical protein